MPLDLMTETVNSLIDHEGFRSAPYQDTVGVWTFGHGLTYLTEAESLLVMRHRLEHEYLPQCQNLFPSWDAIEVERQIVLLNMMYNLGPHRLSGFHRMRAAINEGDFDQAAVEMLDSRWAKQVGDDEDERAWELAQIMRNGGAV